MANTPKPQRTVAKRFQTQVRKASGKQPQLRAFSKAHPEATSVGKTARLFPKSRNGK